MNESKFKLQWIPIGGKAAQDEQLIILQTPFPDRDDSKIDDLVSSVAMHGVLSPILAREVPAGLQIVCGQRRYRAALEAGLTRIPALIARMDDAEAVRSYLSQKLMRRPFSLRDQEQALRTLREFHADTVSSTEPMITAPPSRGSEGSWQDALTADPSAAADVAENRSTDEDPNRSLRAAQKILKRTEALFNDALARRVLPPAQVEGIVDSLLDLIDRQPTLDLRHLVPETGEADPTPAHSVLVAGTCHRVANALGYSQPQARTFVLAGLLHDIGMVFIREAALRRPQILRHSEKRFLHSHTRVGCAVIQATGAWDYEVAWCARDHHERHNGSGYPAGKRGSEVSTMSRLMGLIDSYCSMVSQRAHRRAISRAVAWDRLGKATDRGLFDKVLYQQLAPTFASTHIGVAQADRSENPKNRGNTIELVKDSATMPVKGSLK